MALPAVAGNVCTWKGGSGKFSDANWDVAPVSGNGDTLVFDTSNGTAITVENDLADDFAIRALKTCAGEGWASFGTITLTGRRLYFDATASRSDVTVVVCGTGHPNRGAPLTFNLPLRFKAENWPRDLHLEVSVVKGEQILSLVSQTPGAVVIFR